MKTATEIIERTAVLAEIIKDVPISDIFIVLKRITIKCSVFVEKFDTVIVFYSDGVKIKHIGCTNNVTTYLLLTDFRYGEYVYFEKIESQINRILFRNIYEKYYLKDYDLLKIKEYLIKKFNGKIKQEVKNLKANKSLELNYGCKSMEKIAIESQRIIKINGSKTYDDLFACLL